MFVLGVNVIGSLPSKRIREKLGRDEGQGETEMGDVEADKGDDGLGKADDGQERDEVHLAELPGD